MAKDTAKDTAEKTVQNKGKRSAARAKPKRGLADSISGTNVAAPVRGSKKRREAEAKLQQASERKKDDSKEDRINVAANYMLREDKEYMEKRRIWWGGMLLAIALTFGSIVSQQEAVKRGAEGAGLMLVSHITLALSFAAAIGAFIYVWRVIRPYRFKADERARAMTAKKREEYIAERKRAEQR